MTLPVCSNPPRLQVGCFYTVNYQTVGDRSRLTVLDLTAPVLQVNLPEPRRGRQLLTPLSFDDLFP